VRRIGCRHFQGHPSVYHDKPVPRTAAAWIANAFAVGEATGRQLGAFYTSEAIDFGFTRLLTIRGAVAMDRSVVSEIDLKMMKRCVELSKTVRRHGEFPFTSLVCNGAITSIGMLA
jgi:hypothetical protein